MEKNHIYIMFDAHRPFMEFDFLFSLCGPRLLVHPPTKWSLYCPLALCVVLCCVVTRHKNGHILPTGQLCAPSAVNKHA